MVFYKIIDLISGKFETKLLKNDFGKYVFTV